MTRRGYVRLVLFCLLMVAMLPLAYHAGASTPSLITGDRASEPVILRGSTIPLAVSVPVDRLAVYAYRGGTWQIIPFQVDEVNGDGDVVATEDGVFDPNDEIVFMAQDLGEPAGGDWPDETGQVDARSWQQIEVTDPLNTSAKGYAYVVQPNGQPAPSPTSYVSFDEANQRVIGQTYQLGYSNSSPSTGDPPQPNIWFDYLSLGGGADILDRTPKFEGCATLIPGGPQSCLKEQFFFNTTDPENGLSVVKEGPIRIPLRANAGNGTQIRTRIAAYGALASWRMTLVSPTFDLDSVRVSTDFTENVSGATYRNAAIDSGVTIDGTPDTVPATPFSQWFQIGTSSGALVQVSDVSEIGGTPRNYYVDEGTMCNVTGCDTGDMRKFGDSGVAVDEPNDNFTYRFNQYFVAGQQGSIGAKYQGYYTQPLTIRVETSLGNKVYAPLVIR
jgi:hypothetical protein